MFVRYGQAAWTNEVNFEQVEMDQNIDDLWSMDDINICLLYCIYIHTDMVDG